MELGLYGPERLQYASGGPVSFLPVYVMIRDTSTLAVLYGDPSGSTTVANPVWTDQYGELTFFTELGDYDLWANDQVIAQITLDEAVPGNGQVTPRELVTATRYTHTQNIASAVWTIDHTLGYKPAGVAVVESTGDPIFGAVEYPSPVDTTVKITFTSPCSGVAYLS
jgi:hypothetical protein